MSRAPSYKKAVSVSYISHQPPATASAASITSSPASSDYGDFDEEDIRELSVLLKEANAALPTTQQDDDNTGNAGGGETVVEVVREDDVQVDTDEWIPTSSAISEFISTLPLSDEMDLDDVEKEEFHSASETLDPDSPSATLLPPDPDKPLGRKPGRPPKIKPPFELYRPGGTLSVSDLIALDWCEVQYGLNMSTYGKIPRTAAMTKGSAVHEKLEAEVHDLVPITCGTREEGWGMRVWNIILGLRTASENGLTRELPVFGDVRGRLVTGIIDEVLIKDGVLKIRDQKTRSTGSLPTATSPLARPARMQLMLYKDLLESMRTLPEAFISRRLRFDLHAKFGDAFLAQMSQVTELDELLEFNTLEKAFKLMRATYASIVHTISPELQVEYRNADGDVLGTRDVTYDEAWIKEKTALAMDWWEGKRVAIGVPPAEAWKCKMCEFADERCTFRLQRIREWLEKKKKEKEKELSKGVEIGVALRRGGTGPAAWAGK